jgi:hypothetical protein
MRKNIVLISAFVFIFLSYTIAKPVAVDTLGKEYEGSWYLEAAKEFKPDGSAGPAVGMQHTLFCHVKGNTISLLDENKTVLTIAQTIRYFKLDRNRIDIAFKGVDPNDLYWTIYFGLAGGVEVLFVEAYNDNKIAVSMLFTIQK